MSDNEQLIGTLEKLEITPLPSFPEIKTEYYSATSKQSELINRTLTDNASLKNGKISVKFNEPIWVYDLTLWTAEEDQAKADKLSRHVSVEVTYARGGKKELPMSTYSSYVDCYPKDFLTEVEFKFFDIKKTPLSTPPACKKIAITGLNSEDYYDFCEKINIHLQSSKKLSEGKSKLIEELRDTNQKISEAQDNLAAAIQAKNEAIDSQHEEEEKLSTTQLELSKSEAKVTILNSKSADLEQRINQNEQSNRNLTKAIQDNREKLDILLANKNVFMEEFSSYVEQGKSNITTYILIGLVLTVILGSCLWRLIESALALSNDPTILSTVSAFDLFISRLPIAFVLGAVMVICLRLISILLSKIFEIHQERLLLSKLSILAKDNSFSSTDGLEIPKEIIYEKRVELKMELLKEFLSGNYRGAAEKQKILRERFEAFRENFKKPSEPLPPQEEEQEA